MTNQLEARVADFASTQQQFTVDLSSQLHEFQLREEDKLRGNREYVQLKLDELQAMARQSGEENKTGKKTVDGLVEEIRRASEAMVAAGEERGEGMRALCQRLSVRVAQANKEALSTVRQNVEEMAETFVASLRSSREQLTQDRKVLEEVQSLTQECMQRELSKVIGHNERLQALLAEERDKATAVREKVVKSVGQMLLNFTQDRQDCLETAFAEIQKDNSASEAQVQAYTQAHAGKVDSLLESNRAARESVKEKERVAKVQRMRTEASMGQGGAQLDAELQSLAGEVYGGCQAGVQEVQETMQAVQGHSARMRDILESSRQGQERQLSKVVSSVEEGYAGIDGELQSTLEDVQETCEGVMEGVQDHCALGSTFLQDTGTQLASLRGTARDYLSAKMQTDMPTGTTPQKKEHIQVRSARWSLVPASRTKALRQEAKRKLASDENGGLSMSIASTDESDSNHNDGESESGAESDTAPFVNAGGVIQPEEGPDQTLTTARVAGARRPVRPSGAAPLRETNGNRLSVALPSSVASKIRQPTSIAQVGSVAKRARQ